MSLVRSVGINESDKSFAPITILLLYSGAPRNEGGREEREEEFGLVMLLFFHSLIWHRGGRRRVMRFIASLLLPLCPTEGSLLPQKNNNKHRLAI